MKILLAEIFFNYKDNLVFYIWTVTSGTFIFKHHSHYSNYNLLADGFLKGHLNLPLEPPVEFLALSDPYDPKTNEKFRVQHLH